MGLFKVAIVPPWVGRKVGFVAEEDQCDRGGDEGDPKRDKAVPLEHLQLDAAALPDNDEPDMEGHACRQQVEGHGRELLNDGRGGASCCPTSHCHYLALVHKDEEGLVDAVDDSNDAEDLQGIVDAAVGTVANEVEEKDDADVSES